MADSSRWKQAQSYEKAFWENTANRIEKANGPQLSFYGWRAENLANNLKKALRDKAPAIKDMSVLEVGSGPVGLVSALDAKECAAIDPLCDYFSSQPSLVKHRGEHVDYIQSKGETIPFDDAHFDMVVIENVIDHTQNIDTVMREIRRVLKPEAILYLTVNLHPTWGYYLHEFVSKLRIDKGHPHTFTIDRIRKFLLGHRFDVRYDEWEDYKECRSKDRKSNFTKDRLKALSGLSEFLYTSVSVRT